eukprot:9499277-Pyramimonas_sp.AAC.1
MFLRLRSAWPGRDRRRRRRRNGPKRALAPTEKATASRTRRTPTITPTGHRHNCKIRIVIILFLIVIRLVFRLAPLARGRPLVLALNVFSGASPSSSDALLSSCSLSATSSPSPPSSQ